MCPLPAASLHGGSRPPRETIGHRETLGRTGPACTAHWADIEDSAGRAGSEPWLPWFSRVHATEYMLGLDVPGAMVNRSAISTARPSPGEVMPRLGLPPLWLAAVTGRLSHVATTPCSASTLLAD